MLVPSLSMDISQTCMMHRRARAREGNRIKSTLCDRQAPVSVHGDLHGQYYQMPEVRPGCRKRACACPKMGESLLSLLLISTPNSPLLFLQSHRRTWLKNPMPITSLGPKQRAGSTQSPGRALAASTATSKKGKGGERGSEGERKTYPSAQLPFLSLSHSPSQQHACPKGQERRGKQLVSFLDHCRTFSVF